jgi:hypothetical protein
MFMKLSDRDAFGYPGKFRTASGAELTNPILGLNPVMLLDGDILTGSNDDTIAQWNDISGNNNHASQTTTDNKPLLKIGANGINGHNCIYGDGSNDYMQAMFDLSVYTEMTWAVVYKADSTVIDKRMFSINNGSGAWVASNGSTALQLVSSSYTVETSNAHIMIADFKENSSYNVWQDNISAGSGALGSLNWWSTTNGVNIMTDYNPDGRWWEGKIAYIAMFPTQLSEANRAKVYNFLSTRYIA